MSNKNKVLEIRRIQNGNNNNDKNFWFDEITEESLSNEESTSNYLVEKKLNFIQDPNYYFLKNKNVKKTLNILDSDIFNYKNVSPTINVIKNDGVNYKSELPKHIVELRKKSQYIDQKELNFFLNELNNKNPLSNYDLNQQNNDEVINHMQNRTIKGIAYEIKKEIINEIKDELNRKSSKILNYNNETNYEQVTKEFIKRKNDKIKKNKILKPIVKSILELTREKKYSFEKEKNLKYDFNFKNNSNKSPLNNNETDVKNHGLIFETITTNESDESLRPTEMMNQTIHFDSSGKK